MKGFITRKGSKFKFLGNAVASKVLKGFKFYGADDVLREGTMPDNGAVSQSLNAGGSYTIPEGYHNGKGKISANSLASQTDGTATAADILKDKTAVVDGVKITGTMATMAGQTVTPGKSNQTIACSGKKMTSNIVVAGDADLDPNNILIDKNIFGVAGNVVSGIGIERYCVDMIPSSTSGFVYGTTYTFYWNSSKTTVDYTNCILIISDTGEIIDVSGGVGTTFRIGSFWTATLTSNGFTYAGGSYQNDGQARHVTLIKFKNAKSIQIIDTTSFTTETLHTTSSSKYTKRYYVTIETVDPTKTIILNFDGNDDSDFVPILISSTKLQVGFLYNSSISSLRSRCVIVETK